MGSFGSPLSSRGKYVKLTSTIAPALALVAALAATSAPPTQSLQLTCRVAPNVEPGTKVHVKMRSKYAHLGDPKDIPRGGHVGVGEENEVFVLWAKETLTWEFEVPKSGRVPDKLFTFTFDGDFPPPPPGHFDGVFFPVDRTVVYPYLVGGERESTRRTVFGMRKPTKPDDWATCLGVKNTASKADGLAFSLYPTCDSPKGGIVIPK